MAAVTGAAVVIRIKTHKVHGAGIGTDSIIKNVKSNAPASAYNFSRRTVSFAQRNVHVITGNLKRSIVRVRIDKGHHQVVVGMHYGVYEEYGTRYRPPHPYLRPAIEEAKVLFMRDLAKVFHR